MTKRELINLLEARTDIPDDAEIRVVKPMISNLSMDSPATDVTYEEIGPLLYVHIV
jgi:hypothetical protein